MKRISWIVALAMLAALAGCQGEIGNGVSITCPPGAQLRGAPPPKGEELACWKNLNGEDVKDGPFILFYNDNGGKMMEGTYKDGKQVGDWTMYYGSGQKKSVDHYVDGIQQGSHIGWYENGQISAKGQYKNGEPDGVWKRWGPDGVRNWEEVYKDGKKVS